MSGSEGCGLRWKDDEDTRKNEQARWSECFEFELCDMSHARPRDETIKENAWTHQGGMDGCYGIIHQHN